MTLFLPVYPLARRKADIVASVPELTNRIRSTNLLLDKIRSPKMFSCTVGVPKDVPLFTASTIAFRICSLLCPRISGPHEQQKSINSFPSASQTLHPSPFEINNGVPPTDLNALTGELTPPGNKLLAFEKSFSELTLIIFLCFNEFLSLLTSKRKIRICLVWCIKTQ